MRLQGRAGVGWSRGSERADAKMSGSAYSLLAPLVTAAPLCTPHQHLAHTPPLSALHPHLQIPLLPDATPRLAAVDLDWDHVRAVDILAVLRSFVPKGGAIQCVVVYPSGAPPGRLVPVGRGG